MRSRPAPRLVVVFLGSVLSSGLAGCITGDEAEEAIRPDRSRSLEEARDLEEIGAISESTYELKKRRLETE